MRELCPREADRILFEARIDYIDLGPDPEVLLVDRVLVVGVDTRVVEIGSDGATRAHELAAPFYSFIVDSAHCQLLAIHEVGVVAWTLPDMGDSRWEVVADGIITAFRIGDDSQLELGTDVGGRLRVDLTTGMASAGLRG